MWQLLPIDLIHYILDFVDPDDFINVCRFIKRIRGKMSQQEQEKSKKYLWKRVESDLEQNLLITFPGLGRYAPLSVYKKYLNVRFVFDTPPIQADPDYINLTFMDCKLYAAFCDQRGKDNDGLRSDFIKLSFATKRMKVSCCWDFYNHKFSIKSKGISNSDIISCITELRVDSYNFEDVLRPIPRFATFSMFKDEIIAIINKFGIRI